MDYEEYLEMLRRAMGLGPALPTISKKPGNAMMFRDYGEDMNDLIRHQPGVHSMPDGTLAMMRNRVAPKGLFGAPVTDKGFAGQPAPPAPATPRQASIDFLNKTAPNSNAPNLTMPTEQMPAANKMPQNPWGNMGGLMAGADMMQNGLTWQNVLRMLPYLQGL